MPTATKDAEIKFRTSDELKRQTRCVYDRWGLTLSEAYLLQSIRSIKSWKARSWPLPAPKRKRTQEPLGLEALYSVVSTRLLRERVPRECYASARRFGPT